MHWILRLAAVLSIVFAAYTVTPFYALYRLSQAVQARDLAGIEERVNLKAIRNSLTRQIISTYLEASGHGEKLGSLNRGLAVAAGTSIADPIVARLVSLEAFADLLREGRIGEAGVGPAAGGGPAVPTLEGLRLEGLADDVWRLYWYSDLRGLREFVVTVPPAKPSNEQVGLHLRLTGWTWKLHGVELPEGLRQKLAQELAQRRNHSS